jgi:DNA-binding MarR family transcriptional regulator
MHIAHVIIMCIIHIYLPVVVLAVAQSLELKEPDKAVLRELRSGDRTKGALTDFTGYHRNTVYQALQRLEYAGRIECIHRPTALYRLKPDGQ